MADQPAPAGEPDAPAAPDAALRSAAALVFVEDLEGLELADGDAHHLAAVLRIRPGEVVAASNGAGAWRPCSLVAAGTPSGGRRGARAVRLEATGAIHQVSRALPAIEVGFSLAKSERTEWAVAKLVELGVDYLSPLIAERTVVRSGDGDHARRATRLARIAKESAMQARRVFLPTLEEPAPFATVVRRSVARSGGAVALAEPGGSALTSDVTAILVGPEGGWAPAELAAVERTAGLGDGVLRVETAAVAAGVLLGAARAGALPPGSG